jgi:ferredoxin
MQNIIHIVPEKCVGCNHCVRVCPVGEANIVRDIEGRLIVEIDNNKCIVCNACQDACHHGSRYYEDDTEQFFADLAAGEQINLIVAPAIKSNVSEWGQMLSWLRSLGVCFIYDVSYGADICIWGHVNYIEKNPNARIITQPCPVIVSYIQKHKTELVKHLSPIHSPMLCTAIYMRKYMGMNQKIAALSPCVAKALEFDMAGNIDYNVTLKHLCAYIKKNYIKFPETTSSFDHIDAGLGSLFPTPGGLYENIEFYLGKTKRIDKSEGSKVYKALDEYANQPIANLPLVFDVLNCEDGCNVGTGCDHDKDIFTLNTAIHDIRNFYMSSDDRKKYLHDIFDDFSQRLQLADFMTTYSANPQERITVTPEQIERAFLSIDKIDEESRHHDCGACGQDRCVEMAVQIAKGVNLPMNCIFFVKSQVTKIAEESIEEFKYSIKLQKTLARIATSSVSSDGVVENAANLIVKEGCLAINANRASVWLLSSSKGCFSNIASYNAIKGEYFVQADDDFSQWETYLNKLKTDRVFVLFTDHQIKMHHITAGPDFPDLCAMIAAPIRINGELIGMVSIEQDSNDKWDSERDWTITEQDFVSSLADLMTIAYANAEREKAKNDLDAAHEIIVSSINYAAKIQGNLLPSEKVFSDAFADYAVLWKPRDIVGGDIYWVKNYEAGTVLCVCDCTGHGIPGALLTVLLVDSLESIVNAENCRDTANIVYQLDIRFAKVLNVKNNNNAMEVNDGCDLALMFVAHDGSVTKSAGKINIFTCDGNEVVRHKGQAIFVGEGRLQSADEVKVVTIPANQNNKFYVASDGLPDQIGGDSAKQFGYKQFEQIILQNHNESLEFISNKIWDAFEEHRGEYQRRDDFELIAFKPKIAQ